MLRVFPCDGGWLDLELDESILEKRRQKRLIPLVASLMIFPLNHSARYFYVLVLSSKPVDGFYVWFPSALLCWWLVAALCISYLCNENITKRRHCLYGGYFTFSVLVPLGRIPSDVFSATPMLCIGRRIVGSLAYYWFQRFFFGRSSIYLCLLNLLTLVVFAVCLCLFVFPSLFEDILMDTASGVLLQDACFSYIPISLLVILVTWLQRRKIHELQCHQVRPAVEDDEEISSFGMSQLQNGNAADGSPNATSANALPTRSGTPTHLDRWAQVTCTSVSAIVPAAIVERHSKPEEARPSVPTARALGRTIQEQNQPSESVLSCVCDADDIVLSFQPAEVESGATGQVAHQPIQLPHELHALYEGDESGPTLRREPTEVAPGSASQEQHQAVQPVHELGANSDCDLHEVVIKPDVTEVVPSPASREQLQPEDLVHEIKDVRENIGDDVDRNVPEREVVDRNENFQQFHAREEASLQAKHGNDAADYTIDGVHDPHHHLSALLSDLVYSDSDEEA